MLFDAMISEQQRLNRQTRELWESMASHRSRVTRELLRAGPRSRLCVLGAGNCNDLELAPLRGSFDEVHLVDLDEEAMSHGVARQGLSEDPGIRLHGMDITGLAALTVADPDECSRALEASAARLGEGGVPRCDLVVSCCVFSQLIDTLARMLGTAHPRLKELVLVLRRTHIDQLFERASDGGAVVFISDMVSSDTAPALQNCPDLALAKLRDALIAEGNYFYGTNPHLVERALETHPRRPEKVERRPPWRWRLGERAFLVTALRADVRRAA